MNKYDLREYMRSQLAAFKSSFYATSFDTENNVHLCTDETSADVYDFDEYVLERHGCEKTPASPDAIYIGKKNLYFIEFKNQQASKIKGEQVREKFNSGTSILKSMLERFTPKDCEYHFCVVYKPDPKPKYFSSEHIESNAVRFGLDAANAKQGNFYDSIITNNVDFFKSMFVQLQC